MTAASTTPATSDIRVVGLVAAAHFMSHFYQLVLPPIFPLLVGVFGVGYADLGLVLSVTYVVSGLMQTPAGILVDRLGPARVLIGGLGIYSGSVFLSGLAGGVWWLVPLMAAAGLGNCVFHPADYAIMTARVRPTRLGRAFGAHTLAGNFGWVAAPVAVLALTQAFGWRAALMILGAAGGAFTLYLASQARLLARRDRPAPRRRARLAQPVDLGADPLLLRLFRAALGVAGRRCRTSCPRPRWRRSRSRSRRRTWS